MSKKKTTSKVEKNKDIDFPVSAVVFIVASFLLGFLDMSLLSQAINQVFQINMLMSSLVALFLATVANFTALLWGKENGENSQSKTINRYSVGNFLFWVLIGLSYIAIRTANIVQNIDTVHVVGEALQMVVLAISYIGTGILISQSARKIWDADCIKCRKLRKQFNEAHEDLARSAADLQEEISNLQSYDKNYISLEKQYRKIYTAIHRAETATMSDIVGKVVSNHPEISASKAHEVMNEVLKRREEENEKLHS